MAVASLVLAVAIAAAPAPAPVETAADQVTLRDGQNVLGAVVDPAPRGVLTVLVRRAWAREHVPDWWKRWQAAETGSVRRALARRRGRLEAWRKERGARPERDDPILAWIDHELDRLDDPEA